MSADSVKAYNQAYKGFTSNGASGDPTWLAELREAGIGRFNQLGFPTTRLEEWRFTSVKRVADTDFVLASGGDADPATVSEFGYEQQPASRIVVVNGVHAPQHDVTGSLPSGVVVAPLRDAVREHAAVLEQYLGSGTSTHGNAFAALNVAFAGSGVLVYVPSNVKVDGVVELLYLMQPNGSRIVAHPRTLIVVERGAQLRLVETFAGVGSDCYLTNAVTEVIVADGAEAELYRIQRESPAAFHMATTHSIQGRDSRYVMHTVPIGSQLSRHDVRMVMDGEGGAGTLNGLYVIEDEQHVDHNTIIEHAKPHCESHEYFNGILNDHSHAVFNGRIIVRPGAQKTDSKQTNNNLLLSENARADSQPQLEIYADDVRCTHGATTGPLDDNSLFYLRARGIDAVTARRMLTMGFGMEVLARMDAPIVRQRIEELVKARLESSAGVGK